VRYFPDYGDLLREVDAVSIATPTGTHFAVARDCLSWPAHVLLEKPMTRTVAEAALLGALAQRAGVALQIGHIERFNPVVLELPCVLADLPVVAVHARRLSPFDTSNTDVDVVFDLMIHDLDLVLTLLGGHVTLVHAYGRSAQTTTTDYAVATLAIPRGPLATLMASRVTEQKIRLLEITAVGAYVEADLLSKTISIYRRTLPEFLANPQRPLRYRQEGLVERIHVPSAEPLFLELQDFIRGVRQGTTPRVTAEDGRRAVGLAQQIQDRLASAATEPAFAAG
jgi:predicted dehydrogenase